MCYWDFITVDVTDRCYRWKRSGDEGRTLEGSILQNLFFFSSYSSLIIINDITTTPLYYYAPVIFVKTMLTILKTVFLLSFKEITSCNTIYACSTKHFDCRPYLILIDFVLLYLIPFVVTLFG